MYSSAALPFLAASVRRSVSVVYAGEELRIQTLLAARGGWLGRRKKKQGPEHNIVYISTPFHCHPQQSD